MNAKKITALLSIAFILLFTGCFTQKNQQTVNEELNNGKRGFTGGYATVFLRGTNNSWGLLPMTLTNNNEWSALNVKFGTTTTERFKFDIKGDWSTNFGDSNKDGIADSFGADIFVTPGKAYDIVFNDKTKAYSFKETVVTKCDVTIGFNDITTLPAVSIAGAKLRVSKDGAFVSETVISTSQSVVLTGLVAGNYEVSFVDAAVTAGSDLYKVTGTKLFAVLANDKNLNVTMDITKEKLIQGNADVALSISGGNITDFVNLYNSNKAIIKIYAGTAVYSANISVSETGNLAIPSLLAGSYKVVVDYNNSGKKYLGETTFAITKDATVYSGTMVVTYEETKIFAKTYPTMNFRGTPNGWAATPMTLVADYTWSITNIKSGNTATERFKFDVKGDWSINFGLNGVAFGSDIPLEVNSTYDITFNDNTKKYTIIKKGLEPTLTIAQTSASIYKGDIAFVLPATGLYTKDGVQTSVTLAWTPVLDVNKIGTTVYSAAYAGLPVSFSLTVNEKPLLKSVNQVYFRGTPNSWGTTDKMTLTADYTWQITKTFAGLADDRFKFDINGDWLTNYGDTIPPDGIADLGAPKDIYITNGAGEYNIIFNDKSKAYTVEKKIAGILTTSAVAATIAKGDITFVLPAEGIFTTPTLTKTVPLTWAPALDVNKTGVSVYKATYQGVTTAFTLTVNASTLKVAQTSATIDLGDTTFALPTEGTFTSGADLSARLVPLTWTPALDVNKAGTAIYTTSYLGETATFTVITVAPKLSLTTTSITIAKGDTTFALSETGILEKIASKTAVAVTWTPALDVNKEGTTTYTATYNNLTAQLSLTVVPPTLKISTTSAVITKGDSIFTLPANGIYTTGVAPNLSARQVPLMWTPALDVNKVGATTYTAVYEGLSVTFNLTVNEKILEKKYAQVNFRGTANQWATEKMTLVSDYTWQITKSFTGAADDRFKFDIFGDWTLNFGDTIPPDGIADQGAPKDIYITQGAGDYVITFNDNTKAYTVYKKPPATLVVDKNSAVILKGDTTFALPTTGVYTKEAVSTTVTLTWTPVLDVTKEGTTAYTATYLGTTTTFNLTVNVPNIAISTKSAVIAKGDATFALPATGVYTAGSDSQIVTLAWTPALDVNTVGTTTYTAQGNGVTVSFVLTVANPSLTVSPTDITVTKGDISFTLPINGTYLLGTVAKQVALTWTPALDLNKLGTTVYTAAYAGSTAKMNVTITDTDTTAFIGEKEFIELGDTGIKFLFKTTVGSTVEVWFGENQNALEKKASIVNYQNDGVKIYGLSPGVTYFYKLVAYYNNVKTESKIRFVQKLQYTSTDKVSDWSKDAVAYLVYVRAFNDSNGDGIGDLNGLTDKLTYFEELGVNTLYLMPIFEAPNWHGYGTTDYYKIDARYGTMTDFETLVREAHKKNIRIILDLAVNHTGEKNPMFIDATRNINSPYRDYFVFANKYDDKTAKGPWGQTVWWPVIGSTTDYYYGVFGGENPDWNFKNPKVRKMMNDIASFWVNKGVDGYRLDAAKHIEDKDNDVNYNYWQQFNQVCKAINPEFYTVGEVADQTSVVAPYMNKGMDACFNFALLYDIRSIAGGTYKDIVSTMNYTYDQYKLKSSKFYDASFLTNQDKDRMVSVYGGDVASERGTATMKAKLAASMMLTLKSTPYIYYGEELGQVGSGEGKHDWNLREPFDWYKSASGTGMTTMCYGTMLNTKANDGISYEEEKGNPSSIFEYHKKLIKARKDNPVFVNGKYTTVNLGVAGLYAYEINDGTNKLTVIHNTTNGYPSTVLNQNYFEILEGKQWTSGTRMYLAPYATMILK